MIVLISGMVSNNEQKSAKGKGSTTEESLELLAFSAEPVETFSNSRLSQSIIEQESKKREAARKKAIAKQNKLDLEENAIYLTFDDGPSKASDQLLNILNEYGMNATFFMLAPNIKKYPETVKRMHQEGHTLALHGVTHDVGKIYSSPSAPTEEMKETQEIIENITGIRTDTSPSPFDRSFPYLTEEMRFVLDQKDFIVWDWNVDSRDWEFRNQRYVQHTIQEIHKQHQAGVTPIVLLHDKPETIKHLPKLLSYIEKQGFQTKVLTNDLPPLTFPCEGRCRSSSGLDAGEVTLN